MTSDQAKTIRSALFAFAVSAGLLSLTLFDNWFGQLISGLVTLITAYELINVFDEYEGVKDRKDLYTGWDTLLLILHSIVAAIIIQQAPHGQAWMNFLTGMYMVHAVIKGMQIERARHS